MQTVQLRAKLKSLPQGRLPLPRWGRAWGEEKGRVSKSRYVYVMHTHQIEQVVSAVKKRRERAGESCAWVCGSVVILRGGGGQGVKERQVAFGGEGALPHETTEPKCPSVKGIYT